MGEHLRGAQCAGHELQFWPSLAAVCSRQRYRLHRRGVARTRGSLRERLTFIFKFLGLDPATGVIMYVVLRIRTILANGLLTPAAFFNWKAPSTTTMSQPGECGSLLAMQKKAVLALLVDGARADVLARMAQAGELPALQSHFVDRGGLATATSVFPTVSGPAHLPLLAGVHPGAANLPGIRWAERPSGRRGVFRPHAVLHGTFSCLEAGTGCSLAHHHPLAHVPDMADVNTWFVRGCPGRHAAPAGPSPQPFAQPGHAQLASFGRSGREGAAGRNRARLHLRARGLSSHRRARPPLWAAVRAQLRSLSAL